jgi:zinc protease
MILGLATLVAHATPAPELPFEKYTLPNGLEVILSPDHRVPLVAADIWYHVGAGHEVPGRSGFAHLFEHVMFQGSRNVEEDAFFRYLEGVGAPTVNGTTDFDRTNYFETVPSNQLELALWLESDRMGFLLDTLSKERLDGQIAVVRKERQQSTEDVPYGMADEELYKLLFPAPHPYHGNVIGSHEDLEAATLDDVREFFQTYYAPGNATLVICGDIEVDKTKALVEKYFSTIPAHADPPPLVIGTQPITAERRADLTDEVELPRVTFAWITSAVLAPGDADFQLASIVLAQGKASRMYNSLVREQQIAQAVSSSQYSLTQGSVFSVQVTGKPGVTVKALEAAAWAEFEKFVNNPPTVPELAAANRRWQAGMLRGLESIGGFDGKADILNFYNQHKGDPGYLDEDFAAHAAVTPESVKKYLSQLKADNRVVVTVTPATVATGGAK